MAAFRAHALIAADEIDTTDANALRATVLESVRLWPTTPAILRDTTTDTEWSNGTLKAGTGVVVFATRSSGRGQTPVQGGIWCCF